MPDSLVGTLLPDEPSGSTLLGTLLPPEDQPLQSVTAGNSTMRLNPNEEAPALLAAMSSFKFSDKDRFSMLEKILGKGNVFQDADGEMHIRNPNNKDEVIPFNKAGFSLNDFAQFAGTAAEAAAATMAARRGGKISTKILPTITGAGIANVGKQAVGIGLPGDEDIAPMERATELGTSAALGGLAQGGVNVLGAAVGEVMGAIRGTPLKFLSGTAQKSAATPYGQEGARLARETGIDLSLGQQTGNKLLNMVEGAAGRAMTGATEFFEFQQKQLKTALTKLDSVLSGGGPKETPLAIGQGVNKAYSDALDQAFKLRKSQATMDFGTMDSVMHGAPAIPSGNIKAKMDEMIKAADIPGISSDPQKRIALVTKWKDSIPDFYTGRQFAGILEEWGRSAAGTGDVIADMDTAASRRVFKELVKAAEADLDVAVNSRAVESSSGARALRAARDNYKSNSDAIREIGDSTLAAITKQGDATPEAVTEAISKMKYPSEVQSTMAILDRHNPAISEHVRRSVVESAVTKASEPTATVGASGLAFSAGKFVKALPDEAVLAAYGFSPRAVGEIKDIGSVLERISKREFSGSPTQPLAMAWDIMLGAFSLNAAVLGRLGGSMLAPKLIAKATLTPEGRSALLTLTASPYAGPTKKILASALYMNGLIARDAVKSAQEEFEAAQESQMKVQQ